MIVDNVVSEYLKLRRGLINNDDLPPFFVLEDLIFKKRYFKGTKILSFWKEYVKDPNHKPIDFYIHVPFCYSKCSYCTCPSDSFNRLIVNKYVDDLICFLTSFEEIFKDTIFRNIYIGGGTPSILSDIQLEKLLNYIFNKFKFELDGGKCCEMNPLSVTESKIAILSKYKFNRISFGVQSLNSEVLKFNNRGYQSDEMVKNAIIMAKKAGIVHINIDLIIGLYGDTKSKFLEVFEKALSFKPYTISVYPLSPTKQYINKYFHGNVKEFYSFYNKHISDCLNDISSIAIKSNYFVPDFSKLYLSHLLPSCWHYRDLNIENLKKSYIAGFENNVSVFGVGKYAESKIDGVIKYSRNKNYGDIENCNFSGLTRSPHLEMIYFITETLSKENQISLRQFKSIFNVDILKEFQFEIDVLLKLGVVKTDSDYIYFSVENKKDRFLYLSCFFNNEEVNGYFKSRENRCVHHFDKIINKVLSFINDQVKISEYNRLLESIRFLPANKVINGVITNIYPDYVTLINDENVEISISIANSCLFTREYSKDCKSVYEETVSSSEILMKNMRLVFFVNENNENEALLVKCIIPLD